MYFVVRVTRQESHQELEIYISVREREVCVLISQAIDMSVLP